MLIMYCIIGFIDDHVLVADTMLCKVSAWNVLVLYLLKLPLSTSIHLPPVDRSSPKLPVEEENEV